MIDLELTKTVERLVAGDRQRVATIEHLSAAYAKQVELNESLVAENGERLKQVERLWGEVTKANSNISDGMIIYGRTEFCRGMGSDPAG